MVETKGDYCPKILKARTEFKIDLFPNFKKIEGDPHILENAFSTVGS